VQLETTDLYVLADRDLSTAALAAVRRARTTLEAHIAARPEFATALAPLEPPAGPLPELARTMYAAGQAAGVGPMAAVAGAVAEVVGRVLRRDSREVLVENGGDLYLDVAEEEVVVGLFAGPSPFSGRLGLRVRAGDTPRAICTSSASVGPSLSFGTADAAVAVGLPAAVTDAVATALGNRIQGPADLEAATRWAVTVPGIRGAAVVLGNQLAAAGEIEFTRVAPAGPRPGAIPGG
jgi:ApbE superfamily uncharacterized protein (UPF0280 family)